MNSFKFENYKISEKSKLLFVAEAGITSMAVLNWQKKQLLQQKKQGRIRLNFNIIKQKILYLTGKIHLFYKNKGKRVKINQFELFKKNNLLLNNYQN